MLAVTWVKKKFKYTSRVVIDRFTRVVVIVVVVKDSGFVLLFRGDCHVQKSLFNKRKFDEQIIFIALTFMVHLFVSPQESRTIVSEVQKGLNGVVELLSEGKGRGQPQTQGTGNRVIHFNIMCDGCQNLIVGVRYKCG